MDDLREKAINGLECCLNTRSFEECIEKCPYFQKKLGDGVCSEKLQRDALSLLKGQEARVMTLDEAKNSEVLYFEDFTDPSDGVEPIIRPAVNVEVKNGGILMLDSVMWDDGFTFSTDKEYGKTWRCWTSRPTDEQREKVKWDDQPRSN